jgi:peptidoglycan-associated lipoprotein
MKKIALSAGIAAMLLITGCSKQPNLENAQNSSQTTMTSENMASEPAVNQNQNESVNTQNATVEEQSLAPMTVTVSKTQNNQAFAKKLSSIVIYFDFDKYNIRKDQWPKVEKLANLIKNNPTNYTVRIEGNCDEWGTEEYNYALGLKRANSVKKALIQLGVDPKKLTVISYGELNPVCTAHAKWCWKLNRRDNFTYLP